MLHADLSYHTNDINSTAMNSKTVHNINRALTGKFTHVTLKGKHAGISKHSAPRGIY